MDTNTACIERIKALKQAAETVMLEAQCMETAEQRFAVVAIPDANEGAASCRLRRGLECVSGP